MSNLKLCIVDGCQKVSRALNMCDMHYRRERRILKPHENKNATLNWRNKNPGYRSPSKLNKFDVASKNKQWRTANNEYLREYIRQWRLMNADKCTIYTQRKRALKRTNGSFIITAKEIRRLKSSKCFYCGARDNITIDHIIPLNRGGRNSIGNLLPACQSCNSSKQSKLKVEWERWKSLV